MAGSSIRPDFRQWQRKVDEMQAIGVKTANNKKMANKSCDSTWHKALVYCLFLVRSLMVLSPRKTSETDTKNFGEVPYKGPQAPENGNVTGACRRKITKKSTRR